MKKYFIITVLSIFIGYIISKMIFIEYQSESVVSLGNTYYFLMLDKYQSYDDMIMHSSKLGKYIYIYEDKVYKVFNCVSKSKENIFKAKDTYGGVIIEYKISDEELKNIIDLNDKDFSDISSSCENSIKKYKEG